MPRVVTATGAQIDGNYIPPGVCALKVDSRYDRQ